jgi:hypothetical protein
VAIGDEADDGDLHGSSDHGLYGHGLAWGGSTAAKPSGRPDR